MPPKDGLWCGQKELVVAGCCWQRLQMKNNKAELATKQEAVFYYSCIPMILSVTMRLYKSNGLTLVRDLLMNLWPGGRFPRYLSMIISRLVQTVHLM